MVEIHQVTRELTTLVREASTALTAILGVAGLTAGEILAESATHGGIARRRGSV